MLPCYLSFICIICYILLCHIDLSEIKEMLCYVMLGRCMNLNALNCCAETNDEPANAAMHGSHSLVLIGPGCAGCA